MVRYLVLSFIMEYFAGTFGEAASVSHCLTDRSDGSRPCADTIVFPHPQPSKGRPAAEEAPVPIPKKSGPYLVPVTPAALDTAV